jgi:hypothetical protein
MTYPKLSSKAYRFARRFPTPHCPGCGDTLVAPTTAAFGGAGRVLHLWACDECGSTVHTAVDFEPWAVPDACKAPRQPHAG